MYVSKHPQLASFNLSVWKHTLIKDSFLLVTDEILDQLFWHEIPCMQAWQSSEADLFGVSWVI